MGKVRCICVDDFGRPLEIPPSKCVVKDKEYHITHIFYHPQQKIQGVEVAEIFLDGSCFPYQSFALSRFGIAKEDLESFLEMLKDCTELNKVEIDNIVEELTLETV